MAYDYENDDAEKEAAANELFDAIAEIVKTYKSPDMDGEKVVYRMGVIGAAVGITRTSAMGAAMFAGVYGCFTGLTKSQILGLVGDLFDAVEANPNTPEVKLKYADYNAKSKAQAAAQSPAVSADFGDVGKGVILSPMPKLKQ